MKKITVLHVIDSDTLGGAQDLLEGILKQYDRQRFQMDLCLLRSGSSMPGSLFDKTGGGKPWIISKPPFSHLNLLVPPSISGKECYDILHTHLWTSFVWASAWLPRLAGQLVSSINHTRDQVPFYYFPIYKKFARSKTVYFALNGTVYQDLVEVGIDPSRISLQYIGIDNERFDQAGDIEGIRKLFGISVKDRIILRVARLEKDKKHPLFIQAMKLILEKVPNVKLLLAGEGSQKGKLQGLIDGLGLSKNVKILGECRSHLPDLNRVSEIAFSLGWGSACTENMLCGLPVISFDQTGVREVIKDGINGIIVPSGDVEKFAEAAVGLLSDKNRRKEIGRKARETVMNRYTFEKVTRSYEAFYERMTVKP